MYDVILKTIEEKKNLLSILENTDYIQRLVEVGDVMVETLKSQHKILTAGNGGSAADAQHFTGEIVGRFLKERAALPSISLCVDPVVMTCISNDYGFEKSIARQLEGVGQPGDFFMGISTSGNSANIIEAVKSASERGIKTLVLSGRDGGQLKELCDYALIVPSDITARIQEIHTFTIHMLCQYIEEQCFA